MRRTCCYMSLIVHPTCDHEQIEVVEQVLGELGTNDKEKLTVYNKIDQCPLRRGGINSSAG